MEGSFLRQPFLTGGEKMVILAMLLLSAGLMGLLYQWFYLPTQKEKNTALGVTLTEEGWESIDTRQIVKNYRSLMRKGFLAAGICLLAAVLLACLNQTAGILAELFVMAGVWHIFFYWYQSYHRQIIWLKYEKQWFDDTAKHMCRMKEYIGVYKKELVNDMAFVPLFLLPFLAFLYPGTRAYLQGNLLHGVVFLLPFVILLAILSVYYTGKMNRNLVFFFAFFEQVAMLAFQWKLLVDHAGAAAALCCYLLLLLLGIVTLFPYIRGILIDKELDAKEFPERMPSEGEELWLYGVYRNKKERSLWVKRSFGGKFSLNHVRIGAKVIRVIVQFICYMLMAVLIWNAA